MQPTMLQQILKDIGDIKITKDTKVPALVPGLTRTTFGIGERKVEFKQLCLAAYRLTSIGDVDRHIYQIKSELRQHEVKILPYPFDTKEALIETIKELGKNFNCPVKEQEIISNQNSGTSSFWKYYLFVVLIPSVYYK